jgi:hypothetical protein
MTLMSLFLRSAPTQTMYIGVFFSWPTVYKFFKHKILYFILPDYWTFPPCFLSGTWVHKHRSALIINMCIIQNYFHSTLKY